MISDSRRVDCKVFLRLWKGSTMCLLQLWPSPRQLCRPLIAPAPKAVWKNYAKSASGGCKVWEISFRLEDIWWSQTVRDLGLTCFVWMCGCIFQDASLKKTRNMHPCYYEEKRQIKTWRRASWKTSFLFHSSKSVDSENETSDDNSWFFFFFFHLWSPFFHIAFRAENMATWLRDCRDVWIDAFMRLHNGKIQQ